MIKRALLSAENEDHEPVYSPDYDESEEDCPYGMTWVGWGHSYYFDIYGDQRYWDSDIEELVPDDLAVRLSNNERGITQAWLRQHIPNFERTGDPYVRFIGRRRK